MGDSAVHPVLQELLLSQSSSSSASSSTSTSEVPGSQSSSISALDVLNDLLHRKIIQESDVRSSIKTLISANNNNNNNKTEHSNSHPTTTTAASTKTTAAAAAASKGSGDDDDAGKKKKTKTTTTTTTLEEQTQLDKQYGIRRRHIAIQFYYDGGSYSGLAQNVGRDDDNSVERQLFYALQKANLIESRESCGYSRCGRTDKGVSSAGQVIAFHLKSSFGIDTSWDETGTQSVLDEDLPKNEYDTINVWTIPRKEQQKTRGIKRDVTSNMKRQHKPNMKEYPYSRILNNILPPNIRVLGWTPVTPDFSARFSATTRTYRYFFWKGPGMDLYAIREGLKLLIGKHDFRNLCKMDVEHVSNFERVIHSAELVHCSESWHDTLYDVCYIQIVGQAFLWHQIRCIVEVLFYIGRGLESPTVISDLLNIEKLPGKPSYPMADEKPLVLHRCGFTNLQFAYSVSNLWTTHCQLERQWEDLILQASRIRNCIDGIEEVSVRKDELVSFCQSKLREKINKMTNIQKEKYYGPSAINVDERCEELAKDQLFDGEYVSWSDAVPSMRHWRVEPHSHGLNTTIHVPLLNRAMGTTYEEKVQSLQLNAKRKMRYEDNVIHKRQPTEVDKEFYARKQREGGQGF